MENTSHPIQKKIILVLGMHRSGTSALTRVISLKGVGLPANLMPPIEGVNAAGFWESDDVVDLHERIFSSLGLSWQSVDQIPNGWFSSGLEEPFKEELEQLLSRNFEVHDTLVIKDPRTSRMVPLWKTAAKELGIELSFVIAIRNPLEVAASLKARSGFAYQPEGLSYAHSFQLWLRYFLEAEYATRGEKRAIVSYEQLMDNWQSVVRKIEKNIGFHFPQNNEETTAAINSFISAGHRHHQLDKKALAKETEASDTLKKIYAVALKLTEDKPVSFKLFDKAREGASCARDNNPLPFFKQALYYICLGLIQPLPFRLYAPLHRRLVARNTQFSPVNIQEINDNNPLVHYLLYGVAEQAVPHILFDKAYYLANNKDVAAAGVDPFLHFLISGAKEGRNPHPLFEISYYNSQNPGLEESGVNPLLHFLAAKNPASPHPLFDMGYYRQHNPDLDQEKNNLLVHFVTQGGREGRSPHILFDAGYYLHSNPDVAASGVNPLIHFVLYGMREGRNPHPLFDVGYYYYTNPHVAAHNVNPLWHFIETGAKERRNPHPLFDMAYYLNQDKNVAESGVNPLVHFIEQGAVAGLLPNPLFDTGYYLQHNPDVQNAHANPLSHYITYGADENRDPHILFNTKFYTNQLKQKV